MTTAGQRVILHEHHLRHLEHLAHEELMHQERAQTAWNAPAQTEAVSYGIYSPSQLGALWLQAGGSPAAEGTAECIAHFESGGNANAISPTDDFGLWQINGSHGALATLNPASNARAAVIISDDGTDWGPWTTAPDCGV
jgi:hypothetical protein